MALNFSVFYDEICERADLASLVAKEALKDIADVELNSVSKESIWVIKYLLEICRVYKDAQKEDTESDTGSDLSTLSSSLFSEEV